MAVSEAVSSEGERAQQWSESRAHRIGPTVFRAAAILVWWYLGIVLLYDSRIGPIRLGTALTMIVLVAGSIVVAWAVRALSRRPQKTTRLLDAGLLMLASLAVIVAADVVFTMRENLRRQRALAAVSRESRESDPRLLHGELFPRSYRPTERNFTLYKPNVRVEGETYGEYYAPAMRGSRLLMDSVVELRHVSYAIGPHGMRELEPLGASRIFALGDSFVMGHLTAEGQIWTDRLGVALGEPVYNLGVSVTGPRPQLELLRYFLTMHADSAHPVHVLWMLFEGNDLENDYAEVHSLGPELGGVRSLLEGTIVQALVGLPRRLKEESLISRLVHGELRMAKPTGMLLGGRAEIDGVSLSTPLYHSTRWGYHLFSPADVERATKTNDYVLNHPHRVLLDSTFREMHALSQRNGFRVTVLVAPSDARLYGKDFEGFPALSDRPYFTEYVVQLARNEGFTAVDLLPLLRPFADREMLYYRDDHHWNARGNEVVASIIQQLLTEH